MGTLPRDGAVNARRLAPTQVTSGPNGVDGEVASALPSILSPGASVETRFPWRDDDKGDGNDEEKVLDLSGITETQSEGKGVCDGEEETKEDDDERMELVVSEDTETQEVELALVDSELVEMARTRLERGEASTQARSEGDVSGVEPVACRVDKAPEVAADERLLRAVVACADEFADPSIQAACVWNAIALHCGRGRFASGVVAQARVLWLRRVRVEEPQRVHGDLVSLLQQCEDTQKTPVDAVDPNRKPLMSASKLRSVGKQIKEKLAMLANEKEEDSVLFPTAPTASKRQPNINAALEANVMGIVLRFAPQFASARATIRVWNMIAENSCGRYETGESARGRTAWLCKVLENRHHGQHAAITPVLREKLVQYLELDPTATHKMSKARHESLYGTTAEYRDPKTPKTINETDEHFMALVVQKWPFGVTGVQRKRVWTEIAESLRSPFILNGRNGRARVDFLAKVFMDPSHREHEKLTPNLRLSLSMYVDATGEDDADEVEFSDASDESYEDSDGDKDSSQQTPTEIESDALLREILRVRPFHAPGGSCMGEWHKIMTTLRHSLRRKTVFPTAQSCLSHMKRLLRSVRVPQSVSTSKLPAQQLKMLQLIDTLLQIRWPKPEEELTANYQALQRQIDDLLQESPVKALAQTEHRRPVRRVSMQNSNAGNTWAEESDPEFANDSSDSHVDAEKLEAAGGRKRKQGDVGGLLPVAKRHDHPVRDQATQPSEIKTLYTEVAMCRAQMTLQSSSFNNERRAHRAEMQSMMGNLKQERAANGRATAAMLELVRQEQEDRRLAFDAMMQLVTRSLFPARE